MSSSGTVSYTHLDVYKRQHHKDSFELIGLFFAFYINREQKECKGVVTT